MTGRPESSGVGADNVLAMTGGFAGGIVSPFPRLRALLEPHQPGAPAIDLGIGEPKHQMPAFLIDKLVEAGKEFGKYPPMRGSEELLSSIAQWLGRRYDLAGKVDPARDIMVLNGSREGLFSAVFPATGRKLVKGGRPVVLLPNPYYPPYLAATMSVGAEPVFLPATKETGGLPDLEALAARPDVLARTVAFYLCSPANPQGAVASEAYLAKAIGLARQYDFILFSDECYCEVYTREPPPGALEVAGRTSEGFKNVVAFNSLSKRSNVPGLRSGFVAGDGAFIQRLFDFRNISAPHVPLPVQHASAALWSEEQHVTQSRTGYIEKFEVADKILGHRYGYQRPGGGFLLWLDMSQFGGGENAAVTLWKRCGVRVVPGAYLATDDGPLGNPGLDYVRVALVHDTATTREALERFVDVFS